MLLLFSNEFLYLHFYIKELMMENEMIRFFRTSKILSEAELHLLANCFQKEIYKKKALIHSPPALCRKAYFICEDIVRQSYQKEGTEITAYLYLKNSFFTDLYSFLKAQPCKYSFHAVSDCCLQSISVENLEKLYTLSPNFERWGRLIFENISLEVIGAAERLLLSSPEERFLGLLKESPQVFQLLSQKHIASLLGVTPESLSRIKKRTYRKLKS